MSYCEKTSYFSCKDQKDYKDYKDQDCILETVKKVDQIQKEAVLQGQCEGCETSLCQALYNTKPVVFYLKCGNPYTVKIPGTNKTTEYFRIQEVKGNCVKLRLIDEQGASGKMECIDFTTLLDLRCVCGIQCFPAICCEPCAFSC